MVEPEADPSGRNFSGIVSRQQAEALVKQGELEWLRLLPPEFGGADDPGNLVAVPKRVVREKRRIDEGSVRPLMEQGKVSKYTAEPLYEGTSFIPIAIKIQASEPGSFTATIGVWGAGLAAADKGRPARATDRPHAPKGPPPKGGGGAPEFKLVRSAPASAEKEGMGVVPFVVVGVLAVAGVGGWFVTRGDGGVKDGKKPLAVTDRPQAATEPSTATEPDPPAVKVFMTNRLDWLEEQGQLKKALQEAEEKLREYPKAGELRRRVEELRVKNGSTGPAGTDLGQEVDLAAGLIDQGRFAEAITRLDAVLEPDPPPDAIAGRAYFFRAFARARTGQKLDAQNDVESAAAAKFDPARCEELRKAIANMR
jgi:hypothetical protein